MNQAQKSRASPCCSMVKRLLLLLITACMNSCGLTYASQNDNDNNNIKNDTNDDTDNATNDNDNNNSSNNGSNTNNNDDDDDDDDDDVDDDDNHNHNCINNSSHKVGLYSFRVRDGCCGSWSQLLLLITACMNS